MTSKDIQDALNYRFPRNRVMYKINNSYIFRWESDFFVMQRNGYCYEIEIKISRDDFFADFDKKEKHLILETGKGKPLYKSDKDWESRIWKRPNKFFYCVPDGLIKINELPKYAGLMTVSDMGYPEIEKQAPFLHKEILNLDKILAHKFFHKYMDYQFENRELKEKLKNEVLPLFK